ncbi:MAG: permease prefix domain 2-containing transporter, partial [Cyclobacteriaceae bacterium]
MRDELAEEVEGDLEEKFYQTLKEHSLAQAKRNYWYQVFHYLRPFAIRNLSTLYKPTYYAMYRNYFKIGWRNILKYKGYSLINISGLAVGMAVATLIGLWLHDELSFNKYHQNHDRIAWVMQNQDFEGEIQTWWSQAKQLAPELRENYGTYFEYIIASSFPQGRVLRKDDKTLTKTGMFMEPAAPEMLTLKMLSGTRQGLVEPNSILLAKSAAQA